MNNYAEVVDMWVLSGSGGAAQVLRASAATRTVDAGLLGAMPRLLRTG